jgi:serine/threonine-protein kinase
MRGRPHGPPAFFVIALVAAIFGFGGIAASTAGSRRSLSSRSSCWRAERALPRPTGAQIALSSGTPRGDNRRLFPREPLPPCLAPFEILQRLGAGGVGEVFLARSRAGTLVAIKTIAGADREAHQGDAADAFAREASVCARLRHPCIVQVRAFLEDAGFAALVFEYVPGVALARVVRLCQASGIRLPDLAAWHVVERVLTALAYAHEFRDERGTRTPIIHRDLSPSNVLVDWSGEIKIADFGLAKVLGVSPRTRLGVVKGTLGCMAPEQARGEEVDERADVYAAALLAWRLATGRAPFGRHQQDEWEMLRAMRNPRLPPLGSLRPDLPEPLLEAVAAALEPERERRKITAHELAEAVRVHVDLGEGRAQLALLLERSKGALERAVRRKETGDSSGRRPAMTMRYEEVALAFDDPPEDGPTFEAHALPSDPSVLAAMPPVAQEGAENEGTEGPAPTPALAPTPMPAPTPAPTLAPTPAPAPTLAPTPAPAPAPGPALTSEGAGASGPAKRRRRGSLMSIVLAFALLAVGFGALVATCAR